MMWQSLPMRPAVVAVVVAVSCAGWCRDHETVWPRGRGQPGSAGVSLCDVTREVLKLPKHVHYAEQCVMLLCMYFTCACAVAKTSATFVCIHCLSCLSDSVSSFRVSHPLWLTHQKWRLSEPVVNLVTAREIRGTNISGRSQKDPSPWRSPLYFALE